MKKLTVLLFEMLFFLVVAKAQHVWMTPLVEKTVAGTQYGSMLVFRSRGLWSFGGFYQSTLQEGVDGLRPANFCGLTVAAPLMKSGRMNFYGNVRAGLVDQTFVAVVPGLETELKLSRKFSLAATMSIRMTYPSAGVKLYIRL